MSPGLGIVVATWSIAAGLLVHQAQPSRLVGIGHSTWQRATSQVRYLLLGVVASIALIWWRQDLVIWLAAAAIMAAAWQLPATIHRLREERRRERCEVELTHALGELVMGVESGLTLEMVMSLYAHRKASDLAEEFTEVLNQIALGASRTEALEELRRRTPTPEVSGFVTAVQQNQRIGTPLAEILRQQAHTARRRRRQAVEEHAATLSLKMIFPTVFCILPVLLVVIVGPSIIRLINALPS
jgi:tight adherence protein C